MPQKIEQPTKSSDCDTRKYLLRYIAINHPSQNFSELIQAHLHDLAETSGIFPLPRDKHAPVPNATIPGANLSYTKPYKLLTACSSDEI